MSMENSAEEVSIATEKKDENESQKSMSDGEIVDDDDVDEDVKSTGSISIPVRKLQKNFRARHSDSDDNDEAEDGAIVKRKSDKTPSESKKLSARIVNGDEKYLQSVRKKIINELNEKSDVKRSDKPHHNDRRGSFRREDFHHNRFNNNRRDNRFRPPSPSHHANDSFRRNNNNVFNSHNNARIPGRDRRENGKRDIPSDVIEVRGRYRFIYFPKNSIKHTKALPSLSYAENPKSHLKDDGRDKKKTSKRTDSRKEKPAAEKRRSRSRKRSTPSKERPKAKKDEEPKQEEQKSAPVEVPQKKEATEVTKTEVKLTEQNSEERTPELPLQDEKVEEKPEVDEKNYEEEEPEQEEKEEEKEEEEEEEEEDVQVEERMKFEPIIIERKKIRKIERPKVNIFLEDSDEVDEFENANVITTLEVKSKWSSPDPPAKVDADDFEDEDSNSLATVPKTVESRFREKHSDVPVVVESPEKSPITQTESIFDASSISKSPTPMSTGKPVKNVCSFLSDIESEGYLSGFSLGSGLYSDDDENDDEDSKLTQNHDQGTFLNAGTLFNPEPDTTVEKVEEKTAAEGDSDSDDSDSSSSSESSSDSSSSSESEDESSDSSDDETTAIVRSFGGFGRFDATSIPMVTQIKPVVTQTTAGTTDPPVVVQSRFQPHQSIIRPPTLITNLTRPMIYAPTQVMSTPSPVAPGLPFATPFAGGQFPVPFKIYSLKDAGNSGIIFPSTPSATPIVPATPVSVEKERTRESEREKEREKERDRDKEREREKRPEKRERERHRSRSHERDRKRHKDDRKESERRKTPPPKRRSHSPKKRSVSPRRRSPSPAKRKHADDKRDAKRRDPSPRHSSTHSSRSRHSPVRRRRSRSRSPARAPINARPRTPPSRPRTPPPKVRRISPRRSHSRSPPAKFRRSSSPSHRNHHHHHGRSSPSPIYRRSPRRRYSRSPVKDQNHVRRTPSRSPDYERYDRRSYSPSFRDGRKTDSPSGGCYKPDSTISDTELERQQQFAAQNEFYSWNSALPPHSPRRQNLDERIHRLLSESPTPVGVPPPMYAPDGSYAYPQLHDNHLPPPPHSNYHHQHHNHHHHHHQQQQHHQHQQGAYYPDIYPQNHSSFMPPPSTSSSAASTPSSLQIPPIDPRYPNSAQHPGGNFEDGFGGNFPSPRFVNNSNLVEITQQKRERQRAGSTQVAVQVGNCLEIVPSNKIMTPPLESTKSKSLSPEEIRQQSEKREQAKLRRKADRERKRMAKFVRKEKLRQEIQKYFDAGINIEDSDDEALIKLRPVNVTAIADRGIIKRSKGGEAEKAPTERREKRVLFTDGIHAGETSSDEENHDDSEHTKKLRLKRKRIRKRRMSLLVKERKRVASSELDLLVQKQELQLLEAATPPEPPPGSPPPHLKQPQLKVITADMFAAFAVNHEPMYYHLHKLQAQQEQAAAAAAAAAAYHTPSRISNDRYRYNKHQPPPSPATPYMQQRYCIPPKPLNSMDPRINQQRSVEKSFA